MGFISLAGLMLIGNTLFISNADAVDLVRKASIEVNGKEYSFPVGNGERPNEVYLLKKAIRGDKEALEMIMQGKDEQFFYIGDDHPRWLVIKQDQNRVLFNVKEY